MSAASKQTALESQDLPCTYLAPHDLSIVAIYVALHVIDVMIICCSCHYYCIYLVLHVLVQIEGSKGRGSKGSAADESLSLCCRSIGGTVRHAE